MPAAFLFWMFLASGLGFAKVGALAHILTQADFGNYAMAVGAAMLLTMLLSVGLIEGTIKRFPRLWVDGDRSAMVADTRAISLTLLKRVVLLSLGLTAIVLMLGRMDDAKPLLLGVLMGYAGILARLSSTLILAIGSGPLLRDFTVYRAVFALAAALGGGALMGWIGAMIGEVIALFATVLHAHYLLKPYLANANGASHMNSEGTANGQLYVASVLTAGSMMLDRLLVNFASGAAMAGSYAFAMILAQIGQLMTNIIGQRVGPAIIRLARRTGSPRSGIDLLMRTAIGMAAVSLAIIVAAIIASRIDPIAGMIGKYQVGDRSIMITGAICFFYLYVILEYALIAYDRERDVLSASLASSTVFGAAIAIAWGAGGKLDYYLLAALATRATQTLWLAGALAIRWRMSHNRLDAAG